MLLLTPLLLRSVPRAVDGEGVAQFLCHFFGGVSLRTRAFQNHVRDHGFALDVVWLAYHCRFDTRELARAAIFTYIELLYNRRRLDLTLRYRTLVQFEQRCESGA